MYFITIGRWQARKRNAVQCVVVPSQQDYQSLDNKVVKSNYNCKRCATSLAFDRSKRSTQVGDTVVD